MKIGVRKYKVLLKKRQWYSWPLMEWLTKVTTERGAWKALPADFLTSETRCLIFRLSARCAAASHEMLWKPEEQDKILDLLSCCLLGGEDLEGKRQTAAALLRLKEERPCML
eukprot:8177954-Lingulodinium_polyedra.AAC.1